MKKTILRGMALLCAFCALFGMLISFSACLPLGSKESSGSKEKRIYESALALIDEAKQSTYQTDAIAKYEEAIKKLESIPDYLETAATLNDAKVSHDKLIIEEIKFCYEFDYLEINDWLAKMYDQKKAESVSIWMDFSQDILLSYYKEIIKVIKSFLKDPNSFTDVGSSFTYTPKAGNAANTVIIQKLTYKIDYTATNGFGGAVRDLFEYTFEDLSYTFESEFLTSAEVAQVLKYTTFENMCDSLLD